ncbi:MAG: transglycosylase SLT domain-containing protein, partial [Casimicrobiaceae bacterium]
MRLYLVVAVAVALSACATAPPPPVVEPPPPVVIASEPPPPPPPPVVVVAPKPREPELFPAAAGADLEPLPPPVGDLWERIVAGYAIPDLDNDPLVEKWEQWYSSRPEYMARMIERSRRYLYHIVTEVNARKMPTEIALLPMIESAFNPVAMSTSRAAGIWQFIPSTGKHYGLAQNFWVDSRRDVLAATDKALTYLIKLNGYFDDWQLALAAYNWGEGNVGRAIARNKAQGQPTSYASLAMPAETRNYLPKLQAVKNIVRDPEKYGLALADIPDAPFFAVVKTTKKMDTKHAAQLAELTLEDFLALNPQHNRPVIAGADEHSILLPIDKAELFAAKLELTDQPRVSWQAYRLKGGESLVQVAAKYSMSVETLRAVNGLGARARVPDGHTLLVPAQR